MKIRTTCILLMGALALAACNRSGEGGEAGGAGGEDGGAEAVLAMPEQFLGVWADDCSRPFVRFEEEAIHIYPDAQTYPLTAASYDGQALHVAFTTGNGPAEETYVAEGEALRLTEGVYDGEAMAWDKLPMERCE